MGKKLYDYIFAIIFFLCFNPCFAQDIVAKDSLINPENQPINNQVNNQDSIFTQVDKSPLFMGCADELSSQTQQEACSLQKIANFLSQNLVYPDSAKAKKTAGLVLLRFVVDTNGKISQTELLRDLGEGCGKEALRVLLLMPNFSPAIKEGKKVACYMTLPVRFRELDTKSPNEVFSLHWGAIYGDKVGREDIRPLLNQAVEARDLEGNILKIKHLEVHYVYKNRVKKEKVYAAKLNKAQQKLISTAKKGSFLVFVCKAETGKNFELVEIVREFELLD